LDQRASLLLGMPVFGLRRAALDWARSARLAAQQLGLALARVEGVAAVFTADIPATDGDATGALVENGFRVSAGEVTWTLSRERVVSARPPGLRFRPAEVSEIHAVADLVAACPVCSQEHRPWLDAQRRELMARERIIRAVRARRALIASSASGEPIGVVDWRAADPDEGELDRGTILLEHACVRSDQRRRGLYELLVRQALASLTTHGGRPVSTRLPMNEVVVSEEARALSKLGFAARPTSLRLVRVCAGFPVSNTHLHVPAASPPTNRVPLSHWRAGGEATLPWVFGPSCIVSTATPSSRKKGGGS